MQDEKREAHFPGSGKWLDKSPFFSIILVMEDILGKIDRIKSSLDAYRPFPDGVIRQLRGYYRIGLTYSSNALEGNTLTESETKVVIEDGITVGGKSLREHCEAVGHAKAYDHVYSLLGDKIGVADILVLHKFFFEKIEVEDAGKFRQKNVIITGTDYLPPDYRDVPELMDRHVGRMNHHPEKEHPIVWASDVHAEFESIHPFVDGNGRIGRLLLTLLTLKNGYCPVIIPPILRGEYIAAMQKANKGNVSPLRDLIASVVYEEMKAFRRLVETLVTP